MKIGQLLLLSGLLVGASTAFAADETVNEPITVSVNSSTGNFDSGTGNFRSTWRSTDTNGVVIVAYNSGTTTAVNNFSKDYTTDGYLQYFRGLNDSDVKITSGNSDYYVSGFSFEYKLVENGTNVTVNGTAATTDYQTLNVSDIEEGTVASFKAGGTNKGIILKDFTVTLTPTTAALQPYPMLTGSIADGAFSPATTWFNLQMHTGGYCLYNNGEEKMQLDSSTQYYQPGEKFQWCFIKQEDGSYKIYNREAGTDKLLAAPKAPTNGGDQYPRLMAEGNDGYEYTWDVIEAKTKSNGQGINAGFNGKYPFYLQLHNTTAKVNKFQGTFNFWTDGYDDGSVIVPVVVETKLAFAPLPENMLRFQRGDNTYTSTPGEAFQARLLPGGNVNIWFGGNANNMTTTGFANHVHSGDLLLYSGSISGSFSYGFGFPDSDYYVSRITLQAKKNGNGEITQFSVAGNDVELTNEFQTLTYEPDADMACAIVLTAPNETASAVVIKDLNIEVKRVVREFLPSTMVFERGATERRIPALGVSGKSGRLIAVYDWRHNGGDLGGSKNISLHISTSDDNGVTWTEPDYAKDSEGNDVTLFNQNWIKGTNDATSGVDGWDSAFGDAAICGDRESDDVMMISVGGPKGFWASRRNDPNAAIRWISHDGGLTWSAPENISEKIYSLFDGMEGYKVDGMFFGSGRVSQSRHIKVGKYYRMYSVISTQTNGNMGSTRNYALYTDDLGENWHVLGGIDTCPVPSNADEPKCEELPDGSVLLAARAHGDNRNFNIFRYTNPTTGEGHWDSHVGTNMGMGLTINACDGEIYILPVKSTSTGEKCFMALQSFPFNSARQFVSIAWKALDSAEDFATPSAFTTWNGRYQVSKGNSAYSTMVLAHKDKQYGMGFFYEEDILGHGAYDGVYKFLPLETITNGKYEYCPDTDGLIAKELTAKMAEYRAAGNEDLTDVVNAYLANPTYANYIEINRDEYGQPAQADEYDFDYSSPIWPGAGISLKGITITPATATITEGKTLVLNVAKEPANTTDTTVALFSSSDTEVATVDENGTVSALKPGTAVITATVGDFTATCALTVEADDSGISEISGANATVRIHDLQGRRVIAPARGLYIVNGRKQVIK